MWFKPQHHKSYRSLKQLCSIPKWLWNVISIDFSKKLPSSSGFNIILVIVNWLTKQVIFIPVYDTIISVDLAYLFILHVLSKHSISSHVTSDRGSEFMSNFFCSLGTALDMWLHFTSVYHPKGDGQFQTEHMNQTLKQYLYVYYNYQQDNWSKLLSLVEFSYNNAPSTTISVSPFFVNKRYYPNITIYPKYDIAFSWACNFAINLNKLQSILKTKISTAQQYYQKSANTWCSLAPDFKVCDKVFMW